MGKLASLVTLGIGGAAGFLGYNLYSGDYRLYSRHVIPIIHMTWNAEHSHIFGVKAARHGIVPHIRPVDQEAKPYLKTNLLGLDLENPVGLAAGFDKDGEAVSGLHHFGFGFIEVGSTTPEPQPGNMYPRVFRLLPDRAIINRYGFNSYGHEAMVANLDRQSAAIKSSNIVVGVNLGKNREQKDSAVDYITGLRRFYSLDTVKYFVINISSPNTPNLRQMQNRAELADLLERVLKEKHQLDGTTTSKPLLLKIAPDLTADQLRDISSVILRYSKPAKDRSAISGLIISNTTVTRPATLKSPHELTSEEGGLSGPPLKELSTEVIRQMYKLTGGAVPIIGVGGIESGVDAYEKITAGASAVQLYTSMAYFGPPIVREIKQELALMLHYNGFANVSEAIGADHRKNAPPRQYPPQMLQAKAAY